MKKILFLVQLPPPVHGASMMNQHVVDIFEKSEYETKTIELRFVENVADIGSVNMSKIYKMLTIGAKIIKNMITFKPDFVYLTLSPVGGAFYRDVLYVAILKLFRKNIVYHLHGKGIKNNLGSWWKKRIYKFVFSNTTVIHLSPILENDIKGLSYKKIYFVSNGIEKANYELKEKQNETTQLLFLSNLFVSKGLWVLVEACRLLKQKGLYFKLNIVGKEANIGFDELNKKILELELENHINVLGGKYGYEKYEILNNCDALIHPTCNDSFPLVLLEVMQFGLPIVSTYEGAIPEIVDDGVTGFLVPQKDSDALAQKIEILIKDKELREKMGQAGREKFLEKYTLEKFEQNMKKVFKEVVSK